MLQFPKISELQKVIDLIRNAGWIFFDKIFRMATSLVISVWLARYLGPEKFGILNYVYVFPLIISSLASLGLTNILYNEFLSHKDESEIRKIISTSIILKFIAGIFSFVVVSIASIFIEKEFSIFILILISAWSLVSQSLDVVDTYFQSQRKVQYSIVPKLVILLLATVFRAFGLWYKHNLIFFVSITAIEIFLSGLVSFFICYKYININLGEFRLNKSLAKELLKKSWPLMLSELFLFLYVRVDLLMIKQLSNTVELGNYSVAMRITDLWYFIPVALTASLYPSIISLRLSDYQAYLKRYQHLLTIYTIISVGIGLLISLVATPLIGSLYGDKYIDVSRVLSINIWTGLFVFLDIGSNNWFLTERLQRFILRRTIVGAVMNVTLNVILIPLYGASGASVATLITQMSVSYLINGLYTKTREIFTLQTNALFFLPKVLLTKFRLMLQI